VVFLRTRNPTVLGRASIKLVEITDRTPPPAPEGQAWGEPGICEVCVHVNGQAGFYRELVARGHTGLMEPNESDLPPYQTHCGLSYVADPDGAKIELIEWSTLEAGWPVEPGPQGVNHVAFGVADMDASLAFYRRLGFSEMLFESTEFFGPMAPWYDRELPGQHMVMMMSAQGGGIEPTRLTPLGPDCRGEWGHLGPMEFAVGVANLERAGEQLEVAGVEFLGPAQTVDVGTGEWRYRYLVDPDGLYVSLVEARF
jgi:catechol 2,3-dioxygenase-like lactoylglutathione lyase family enzyme